MASVKSIIADNLGPILLGTIINTYLYGLVTYQYGAYFLTKFEDPLWIKSTVLALFCLDTFHSAAIMWMAWVYMIEGFNNLLGLMVPLWPYPLTIAVTSLTAFVTHAFLSYRVYRLTKGKAWYAFIMLASSATLVLGFLVTGKAWRTTSTMELIYLTPILSVWLGLEMALDVVICGVLIYTLSKSRTGFARSDTIIRRLVRAAVQTGTFAAMFAMVTLILFFTKPHTQFYSLLGLPISRVYSNTLMDTILCRGELRELVQTHADGTGTAINSLGVTTVGQNSIQLHIKQEIHVERDDSANIPQPRCLTKNRSSTRDKIVALPEESDKYPPPFHAY